MSTLYDRPSGNSREEQYQYLLRRSDPKSDFERVVLEEIYRLGMKLPDSAQELIPQANRFSRDWTLTRYWDTFSARSPNQLLQ